MEIKLIPRNAENKRCSKKSKMILCRRCDKYFFVYGIKQAITLPEIKHAHADL